MNKGYDVILSLRYTTTIKIESNKEDEEEIKEDARQCFIQDVLDVPGAMDLLELCKVVKIKRNYSEWPPVELAPWEVPKKYEVEFSARYSALNVSVIAECEEDAIEEAEEEMTTCFISEDEKTDCEVLKYELSQVLEIKEEGKNER